ncbi:MAG TPA: CaiB/BaiF CoA-transferase family protein [Caulobacteraceae bacterium]|jgi:crotonobetainyl-CoA:carnitine CoA-transferase CaiB-like acyl-CoA transferase
MAATEPPHSGALGGLRVLDLTRVIAGPMATQILGDLGADVVKIERPGEGDDSRRTGPPWATRSLDDADPLATYFLSVNRNKRSVTLDYSTPSGAAVLRQLALHADVLIENFRPGTLAKYGLDHESLQKANPRLIYCAVTGFGQTGPYAGRSGYDYLVQAMSGVMSVNGPAGGEPTRLGIPIADICAGHYAAMGVLAAVNHRSVTGRGQFVDISLFEAQIAILLNAFSGWFNGGVALGRTGNDHPSAVPYGVYPVDDGQILIATFNNREFARLAVALGHSEWAQDDRFATNGPRVANREVLRALITEALRGGTKAQWVEALNNATVSCGPINEIGDLADDPQVRARGVIVDLADDRLGSVLSAASPLRLSETPPNYRTPPPALGQHTETVLSDWIGLDAAAIADLRAKGVI